MVLSSLNDYTAVCRVSVEEPLKMIALVALSLWISYLDFDKNLNVQNDEYRISSRGRERGTRVGIKDLNATRLAHVVKLYQFCVEHDAIQSYSFVLYISFPYISLSYRYHLLIFIWSFSR